MTKEVDFYFDFASPNAYLSHKVLKSISEKTGQKLIIYLFFLGGIFKSTNNNPPMVQFAEVKGKLEYQSLEITRFIERHGLQSFSNESALSSYKFTNY